MDQTPVFFASHSEQILEMRKVKTVIIDTSTQDTRQATLEVTVCADGTKLPPMLIFKNKQNDRVAAKECQTFPTGYEYFWQENVWMDEGAMLEWVEKFSNYSLHQLQKMFFHSHVRFFSMPHDGICCQFKLYGS